MDPAVQDYIDAIPADRRPLFDRLHQLIAEAHPEVTLRLAYKMPTYCVGGDASTWPRGSTGCRSTGGTLAAMAVSRRATPN